MHLNVHVSFLFADDHLSIWSLASCIAWWLPVNSAHCPEDLIFLSGAYYLFFMNTSFLLTQPKLVGLNW